MIRTTPDGREFTLVKTGKAAAGPACRRHHLHEGAGLNGPSVQVRPQRADPCGGCPEIARVVTLRETVIDGG